MELFKQWTYLSVIFCLDTICFLIYGKEVRIKMDCSKDDNNCVTSCSAFCQSGCVKDGTCIDGCQPGWKGSKCNEVCSEYEYGENCQKSCGHCNDEAVCDVVTGICAGGCIPGFTGLLCDKACEPFLYGTGCSSKCHNCRNNKPCNVVTGECRQGCAAGWSGERCDIPCSNMTYGIECSNKCGHCSGNQYCNSETGKCPHGCEPGWVGHECNDPCDQGWYGEECDLRCINCMFGACDKETGICRSGCTEGWTGKSCQTNCRFVGNCEGQCGQCDMAMCDKVTGLCLHGCKEGWTGKSCRTECDDLRFGANCTMSCGHCKDGAPCNKSTGICEGGCQLNWDGKFCTQKKPADEFHTNANETTVAPREIRKPPIESLLAVIIVILFIASSSTVVFFVCIRPQRADMAARLRNSLPSVRSTEDTQPHLYEQVQSGLWEIHKANLVLTSEKLGQGQFGQVRKGYIRNMRSHNVPVAVKSLKVNSSEKDKTDFINEVTILKKVGQHPNVVCLMGFCNIGDTMYVAMEYCCHGDLRTHLRTSRKKNQKMYSNVQSYRSLSYSSMLRFALDVANGMSHLAARQIIHRDLATRNVLLDDNFVAKIADFGLSKNDDTYVKTSKSKVPIRWMALESIFRNAYTVQSDVWSFGVLLWEIATFGGTPYHGIDTQQLCVLLKQGYRLCRPRHCDASLYTMMLQCWHEEPEKRLEFSDLQTRLQYLVDGTQIYINIDDEKAYTSMDGVT